VLSGMRVKAAVKRQKRRSAGMTICAQVVTKRNGQTPDISGTVQLAREAQLAHACANCHAMRFK
jgi:hypothetical protein